MDLSKTNKRHLQSSIHGGNIEQEAKRLGIDISSLIDASASLVPFTLTQELHNYLIKKLNEKTLQIYPDRNLLMLKEAIGNHHNVHPSMVLPGNGASELITWAARDAVKHGTSLLPSPGFYDYKRALECWDGKYIYSPLPLKWGINFPQEFPIKATGKVIWITNPHNPTGQCWNRNSLENLLSKNNLVICDEAFLPLVPNGERESLIPLTKTHSNLIVIRSLTKLFSIAGLRIGYAISSSQRLEGWQVSRDPWPLNGLAIAIGTKIMSDSRIFETQIQKVHTWINKEAPWLHANLQSLTGIISHPSSTNFQLIESQFSLTGFREKLANKRILLRDCNSFIGLGENWLRISLQKREDNRKILKAMREIISYSS